MSDELSTNERTARAMSVKARNYCVGSIVSGFAAAGLGNKAWDTLHTGESLDKVVGAAFAAGAVAGVGFMLGTQQEAKYSAGWAEEARTEHEQNLTNEHGAFKNITPEVLTANEAAHIASFVA